MRFEKGIFMTITHCAPTHSQLKRARAEAARYVALAALRFPLTPPAVENALTDWADTMFLEAGK